MKKIKKIILWC